MTTALRCLLRKRAQYCSSWMQGRCACALPAPKQPRGALLWASGTRNALCTGSGSTMHVAWGCSKIQQAEGQWGMRPGWDEAAVSLGHGPGVGAGEQLWREGVSCQRDFSQLVPHTPVPAACSQAAATAHLNWPGALAAKPRGGKMVLEAVSAPRSVCTCVTTRGTGLKRRALWKTTSWDIQMEWDIQMAICHLGLWMYLQIGSVFVNQYMQCCWCIYINSNLVHVTVNQYMLIVHGYKFQLVLCYCESISIVLITHIRVLLFCSWWGEPSFEHGWEEEAALQALSTMSQGAMC